MHMFVFFKCSSTCESVRTHNKHMHACICIPKPTNIPHIRYQITNQKTVTSSSPPLTHS